MDDRAQERKFRHRRAVLRHAEEVLGNVAATCRYCGISRTGIAARVLALTAIIWHHQTRRHS